MDHTDGHPIETANLSQQPQWDLNGIIGKPSANFRTGPFPPKAHSATLWKRRQLQRKDGLPAVMADVPTTGPQKSWTLDDFGQSWWPPEETSALEFSMKIKKFVNDKQWAFCVPNRLKERGANRIPKFMRQIRPKRRGKVMEPRVPFFAAPVSNDCAECPGREKETWPMCPM